MLKKFNRGITGLSYALNIIKAIKFCFDKAGSVYLANKHKRQYFKYWEHNFQLDSQSILAGYRFINVTHLEVSSNSGVFLSNVDKIHTDLPIILILDYDETQQSITNRNLYNAVFFLNFVTKDYRKSDFVLKDIVEPNYQFFSIALTFALEEIEGGITAIEQFIKQAYDLLTNRDGVLFGMYIPGTSSRHSKKALLEIEKRNNNKQWHNANISAHQFIDVLHNIFGKKHVTIKHYDSAVSFICYKRGHKVKRKTSDLKHLEDVYVDLH